jgi:death-on-curing protein
MKEPRWVQHAVVLALQERLMAEFGGEPGLRDAGLLESALARPRNRWEYEKAEIFELAAAYAFGLARNHPFLDGNKRIAFTTVVLFLDLNGWEFTAGEADAVMQTLALAGGELDEAGYAVWLKGNAGKG